MVRYLSTILNVNSCSSRAKNPAISVPGQRTTLDDVPPEIVELILGLVFSPIIRNGVGDLFALARVSRKYQSWTMVAAIHLYDRLVHSTDGWNYMELQLLFQCIKSLRAVG